MSFTAILSALATIFSGLVQAVNQYLTQKQEAQDINTGVLQQTVSEEATKANDEAIAKRINAAPTPVDKRVILNGLSAPAATTAAG